MSKVYLGSEEFDEIPSKIVASLCWLLINSPSHEYEDDIDLCIRLERMARFYIEFFLEEEEKTRVKEGGPEMEKKIFEMVAANVVSYVNYLKKKDCFRDLLEKFYIHKQNL